MTWPVPISIRDGFRRVEGLGGDRPCLMVAKQTRRSEDFMRRQFEIEQQPKRDRYLQPLRTEVGEGSIWVTTLQDFAAGISARWIVTGPEPHDAVFDGEALWAAFCGSVRAIDPASGSVLRVIEDQRFTNLHSLSLSPSGDHLLVANPGLDELLELHVATGKIEWSWRPADHGWNRGPFGVAIASSERQARSLGLEPVGISAAQERLRSHFAREGWAIVADAAQVEHPLGLEKWQRVAEPNWAAYGTEETILLTAFCGDSIACISRTSGAILAMSDGYLWPHGVLPIGADEYAVTDTGRAHVHVADIDLVPRRIYSFAEFETDATGAQGREWLQFTTPFGADGLLVSVDARRSKIFVWSPAHGVYSQYPVSRSILVKSVQLAEWADA